MKNKFILLETLMEKAFDMLYETDAYLFFRSVHENAIVFRFGHYLQDLMDQTGEFNDFNLDFEYNRNGYDPKRIPMRSRNGARPDLIIHKRGSNDCNLMVLEFKPHQNGITATDKRKIKEFVDPKGVYKYFGGKSIVFGQRREGVTIWTFMRKDYPDAL